MFAISETDLRIEIELFPQISTDDMSVAQSEISVLDQRRCVMLERSFLPVHADDLFPDGCRIMIEFIIDSSLGQQNPDEFASSSNRPISQSQLSVRHGDVH